MSDYSSRNGVGGMKCIHSHEDGAYCDKHDHGAVTVGCCGEESCPDRTTQPPEMDDLVRRGDVLSAIHNGDIDMGMVTPHEYRLLEELSRRIDRRIQRVPVSDVAPVRQGRNICDTVPGHCEFKCSLCGAELSTVYGGENDFGMDGGYLNYCPNCGARMGVTE